MFDLRNLVRSGVVVDPYNACVPLDSQPTVPDTAEEAYRPGRYIFAISEAHEVRIALDCDRDYPNAVKHETLFHNADVLAAGEIEFERGVASKISDSSGSYGTRGAMDADPAFAKDVLTALQNSQVPLTNALYATLADRT